MWIHETSDWPNFQWNAETLAVPLAELRHRQGRLLGQMEALGFDLRREASLGILTNDVVKTSAIEGENLNPTEVRSSIASRLGIPFAGAIPASRDVEGIVEILLDATQNFDAPLTKDRLFNWHAALFPTGRSGMQRIMVGGLRTGENGPMRVVSGAYGREKVHFEAPGAEMLKQALSGFLSWFEGDQGMDPVLKAGIAHFWFVTLHPFDDGNGRIARAIGDLALSRADGTADRFYSLSSQIEAERSDYYRELERQQRGTVDLTPWLGWFLGCLGRAIDGAEQSLARVIYKARLWEFVNQTPVNDRQRRVINRMLEDDFQGHLTTSKYAKLAKTSADTALRDIQDLKGRGVLVQNPGAGRSTSYRLLAASEL